MNLNYWFPWREYPKDEPKDSTYEGRVHERCDHQWSDWEPTEDGESIPVIGKVYGAFGKAKIEAGHMTFPVYTDMESHCTLCGRLVEQRRRDGRAAIPLAYRLDEDASLSEAISEPVEDDEDDGENRILVNEEVN